MNEQERLIVEAARGWLKKDICEWGEESTIVGLVAIIDRLDKQLAEIKKVGEPFVDVCNLGAAVNQLSGESILIKIITEGMVTDWKEPVEGRASDRDYSPKPTLYETFKPPCQVCASMKRIASEALGVKPFWEDDAEELNNLIRNEMPEHGSG